MLRVVPVTFREACDFVAAHHRHHRPPRGHKFSVGVEDDGRLAGVAVAGRPVARRLDDGRTLEVTRVCTDGTPHVASKLLGAVRRAAAALGYERVVTYTLAEEPGTSLRADGWRPTGDTPGRSWDVPGRRRTDSHPLGPKRRWEAGGFSTPEP